MEKRWVRMKYTKKNRADRCYPGKKKNGELIPEGEARGKKKRLSSCVRHELLQRGKGGPLPAKRVDRRRIACQKKKTSASSLIKKGGRKARLRKRGGGEEQPLIMAGRRKKGGKVHYAVNSNQKRRTRLDHIQRERKEEPMT